MPPVAIAAQARPPALFSAPKVFPPIHSCTGTVSRAFAAHACCRALRLGLAAGAPHADREASGRPPAQLAAFEKGRWDWALAAAVVVVENDK